MPNDYSPLSYLFPDPFVEAYYDQLNTALQQKATQLRSVLTEDHARNAIRMASTYGNLPKSVVAAATLGGIDAFSPSMRNVSEHIDVQQGKNLWDHVYGGLKATTRTTFTVFDALWEEGLARPLRTVVGYLNQGPQANELRQIETAYGLGAGYLDSAPDRQEWVDRAKGAGFQFQQMNMGLLDAWNRAGSSIGFRALAERFRGNRVNLGEGFLMNSDLAEDSPQFDQRARQFGPSAARQQIQGELGKPITQQMREESHQLLFRGQPISPGRVLAGAAMLPPGSAAYQTVSGALDMAALIKVDPSNLLLKGVGALRGANRMVHAVNAGEDAAGLISGVTRRTVFRPTVERYLATGRGQRLVRYLNASGVEDTADIVSLFGRKNRQIGHDVIKRLVDGEDAARVLTDVLPKMDRLPTPRGLGPSLLEWATRGRYGGGTIGTGLGGLLGGEVGAIGGLRVGLRVNNGRHGWGRMFQVMSPASLSLDDMNSSLFDFDNFLRGLGLKSGDRSPLLHRFAGLGLDDADGIVNADDAWAIVKEAGALRAGQLADGWVAAGVDPILAREMSQKFTNAFNSLDELRKYATDEAGEALWHPGSPLHLGLGNFEEVVTESGETVLQWVGKGSGRGMRVMPKAHVVSEFLSRTIPLPNARAMRKAQGKVRRLIKTRDAKGQTLAEYLQSDKIGENLLNRMADPFMQRYWKPFTLLRLAWPVRVLGEEQFRMTSSGLSSMFKHPFDYIGFAMTDTTGTRWRRTLAGLGFSPKGQTGVLHGLLDDGISYRAYNEAEFALRKAEDRLAKRFDVTGADIRRRPDEIIDGAVEGGEITARESEQIQEQLAQLRRAMTDQSEGFAKAGVSERDLLLALSDEAQAAMSHRGEFFLGHYRDGIGRNNFITYSKTNVAYASMWGVELRQLIMDDLAPRVARDVNEAVEWFKSSAEDAVALRRRLAQSGRQMKRAMDDLTDGGAAELYVRSVHARIQIKAGGSVRVEYRRPGASGVDEWVDLDPKNVSREFVETIEAGEWSRIRYKVDPESVANEELLEVVATGHWRGTDLREMARGDDTWSKFVDDLNTEYKEFGPAWVKGPVTADAWMARGATRYDAFVDHMFDVLMSKPTNKLSRHPAFVQIYWKRAEDIIGFCAPHVQETILKAAKDANLPRRQLRRLAKKALDGRGYRSARVGTTRAYADMIGEMRAMSMENLISEVRHLTTDGDEVLAGSDELIEALAAKARAGDREATRGIAAFAELRRRLPVLSDDYAATESALRVLHAPRGMEAPALMQHLVDGEILSTEALETIVGAWNRSDQMLFELRDQIRASVDWFESTGDVARLEQARLYQQMVDELLAEAAKPNGAISHEQIRFIILDLAEKNGVAVPVRPAPLGGPITPGVATRPNMSKAGPAWEELQKLVDAVDYPRRFRHRITSHLSQKARMTPDVRPAPLDLEDLKKAGLVPGEYRPDDSIDQFMDDLSDMDVTGDAAKARFDQLQGVARTGPVGPGGIFRDGPVIFRGQQFDDWLDLLDYANRRGWTVDDLVEFVDEMQLPAGMRLRERMIKPQRMERPKPPLPDEAFDVPAWDDGPVLYHAGWVKTGDETTDLGRPSLDEPTSRIRPIEESDPDQLYGPGLYNTTSHLIAGRIDEVGDAARGSYRHDKALWEGGTGEMPKTRRLEWTGKEPPRIIDIETHQVDDEIMEAVTKAVDEFLDDAFELGDDIDDVAKRSQVQNHWRERFANVGEQEWAGIQERHIETVDGALSSFMPADEVDEILRQIDDHSADVVRERFPGREWPTPQQEAEAWGEAVERVIRQMEGDPTWTYDQEAFDEVVQILRTDAEMFTDAAKPPEAPTVRQLYDYLKEEFLDDFPYDYGLAYDLTRGDPQSMIMRRINLNLRDSGIDGFSHQGGRFSFRAREDHTVYVMLNTDDIRYHIDRWEGYISSDKATFDRPVAGRTAGPLRSKPPGAGGRPGRTPQAPRRRPPDANPWVKADDGRIIRKDELARETRQHAFEELLDDPRISEIIDEMDETERLAAEGLAIDEISSAVEADDLLKGFGLDGVKALLYDTSRKHHFMDAYRNVFPFGEAWVEIVSNWAKIMYENPHVFRRFQQIAESGRESGWFHEDPSTGEEMFSYPASGALMGLFAKLSDIPVLGQVVPGQGAGELLGGMIPYGGLTSPVQPWQGRVQGVNLIAGQWLPGFGPVIQVPASYLTDWTFADGIIETISPWKGVEVRDWLKERILPFGEQKLDGSLWKFMPVWFRRVASSISESAGDEQMARIRGNTTIDVLKTLILQGEHPESVDEAGELIRRAHRMAQQLTFIRGIVQFGSPTGPEFKFWTHVDLPPQELADFLRPQMIGMSPSERNDLYDAIYNAGSHDEGMEIARKYGIDTDAISTSFGNLWLYQSLAGAYRERLFGESQGDDSDAFDWFVKSFGMDPTVFATPKTVQVERRHTTTSGDQWARDHLHLFEVAPLTAYYARPDLEIDPFDYNAYLRQLEEEARVALEPDQWLWRRNDTLGRIMYEKAKDDADELYGPKDTEIKRDELSRVRAAIADVFPGFRQPIPGAPEAPSTESKVEEIQDVWFAKNDDGSWKYPELATSPTGEALAQYMRLRERVQQECLDRGLTENSWQQSNATEDLRVTMRDFARDLQIAVPDFTHIWTQVLSHEMKDDVSPATLGNVTDEEAERAPLPGSVGE